MPTVVGGIQRLETQQCTGGFAQRRRLRGCYACQAGLGKPAQASHVQAQGRLPAQRDRSMPQVHVTGDRQPCAGFGQACFIQPVTAQQRLRIVTEALDGLSKWLDEPYREVAQANAGTGHTPTATRSAGVRPGWEGL
ncbi:hypothetical protein D3C79_690520 [compost metagenome]